MRSRHAGCCARRILRLPSFAQGCSRYQGSREASAVAISSRFPPVRWAPDRDLRDEQQRDEQQRDELSCARPARAARARSSSIISMIIRPRWRACASQGAI